MSDPTVLIAVISGVVTVLLAIIAVVGSVIAGRIARESEARKADAAAATVKLTAIEHATNSAATEAKTEIAKLHATVASLTALMNEMRNPSTGRQAAAPMPVEIVNTDEPVDVAVVGEEPKKRK